MSDGFLFLCKIQRSIFLLNKIIQMNRYYVLEMLSKKYTQNIWKFMWSNKNKNVSILYKSSYKSQYTFFHKQLGSGPSPQSYLYFQDFQGWRLLNGCLVVSNLRYTTVNFQHSSLTFCITLVKDQSTFHEILSLATCINITAFNWITLAENRWIFYK